MFRETEARTEFCRVQQEVTQEVQGELKEFVKKVQSLEEKMTEEAQEAITHHAMRTRVEVMQEYFRGEHVSWDLNETMRIYNEAYPGDAFPLFAPPTVAVAQEDKGNLITEGKGEVDKDKGDMEV